MLFTKPKIAIGVDIGSHSIKTVQMSRAGGRMRIDQVGYAVVDRNQMNVDPILAQAKALSEAIQFMPVQQSLIVGALPGQTVVIRYPRLPSMPDPQLAEAVESEAGQNIPYDLAEVFLDWTVLGEVAEGDRAMLRVLLVAAKHEVIDARVQIAEAAEVQYSILGVDSLALADAAEACDYVGPEETVALINVGASTTSIHFTRDGKSNFIRDVSWGGREMIQAICKARRVEYEEGERILKGLEAGIGDAPEPEDEADFGEPPMLEPESDSGALDSLDSGLGGSLLDPLDDELADLGSPAGPPRRSSIGSAPTEKSIEEVLSQPLARLVAEIRRSFDYYEQQLYERPVDRLILSGGIASLPFLRATLMEELGLERVETADPSSGALLVGDQHGCRPLIEHPSQFMVAVGLAARGVAET